MAHYVISTYKEAETGVRRLSLVFMLHARDMAVIANGVQLVAAVAGDGFHLSTNDMLINDPSDEGAAEKDEYVMQDDGNGVIILDLAKIFKDCAEDMDVEGEDHPMQAIEIDFLVQKEEGRKTEDLYLQLFLGEDVIAHEIYSLKQTALKP